MATSAHGGARAEHKRETRAAIENAAWRLFARQGFDETTVEEIADAAGVAPRTFFRYFETKEAVLYGSWRDELTEFCARLHDRPPAEPPLVALVTCLAEMVDLLEADAAELLQRTRIKIRSRRVGSYRDLVIGPAWSDAVSRVLGERLGVDPDLDVRPRLYAGIVSVALDTAADVWIASGGTQSIARILTDVFTELGAPIAIHEPPTRAASSRGIS